MVDILRKIAHNPVMKTNADILYQKIGRTLKQRREELRLSQAEVARELGFTRTSITNIESGKQRLPLHTLLELVDYLRLDIRQVIPVPEEVRETVQVQVGNEEFEVPTLVGDFIKDQLEK